jgi:hypothetical protein
VATYSLWQEAIAVTGKTTTTYTQHSNPLDVGRFVKAEVVAYVHAKSQTPILRLRSAMLDTDAYYGTGEGFLVADELELVLGVNEPLAVSIAAEAGNVGLERFLRWEVWGQNAWTVTLELHVLGYANS